MLKKEALPGFSKLVVENLTILILVQYNTITRSEWYDFYLVSQSTTQGTVNPTHYNVVCDTTCLLPDQLQRLSHKLTHMYYNWPVSS